MSKEFNCYTCESNNDGFCGEQECRFFGESNEYVIRFLEDDICIFYEEEEKNERQI
jgi:hypothetical protein